VFQIIAVPFDAFQALPGPQHRWLLTCLARYTDRTGKCWPTMRQLAADARMSLSTVCRRLQEMADLAVIFQSRLQQIVKVDFGGSERWPIVLRFGSRNWREAKRCAASGMTDKSAMTIQSLRRTAADFDRLQSAAEHFDHDCSRV
jgi:DNA-binding transcriptional MocR family regulator